MFEVYLVVALCAFTFLVIYPLIIEVSKEEGKMGCMIGLSSWVIGFLILPALIWILIALLVTALRGFPS